MITHDMLKHWATQTFQEALTASPINDLIKWQHDQELNEKKIFIDHLRSLRQNKSDLKVLLQNSPITGNLSMGWRQLDNQEIFFQDCLADVHAANPGKWNPADYLLQCYLTAKTKGVDIREMDLGRALRNLPSFMREYLIADILAGRDGIEIEIPSEAMNAKSHVDIILRTEGTETYIWSYLTSGYAIGQLTQKKLNGVRGEILKGRNLLAPFDNNTDSTDLHAWWVPSEAYVDRLLTSLKGPALSYEGVLALLKKDPQTTFSSNILFIK